MNKSLKDAIKNFIIFFVVTAVLAVIYSLFVAVSELKYFGLILVPALFIAWMKEYRDIKKFGKKYIKHAKWDIFFRFLGSIMAVLFYEFYWGV